MGTVIPPLVASSSSASAQGQLPPSLEVRISSPGTPTRTRAEAHPHTTRLSWHPPPSLPSPIPLAARRRPLYPPYHQFLGRALHVDQSTTSRISSPRSLASSSPFPALYFAPPWPPPALPPATTTRQLRPNSQPSRTNNADPPTATHSKGQRSAPRPANRNRPVAVAPCNLDILGLLDLLILLLVFTVLAPPLWCCSRMLYTQPRTRA